MTTMELPEIQAPQRPSGRGSVPLEAGASEGEPVPAVAAVRSWDTPCACPETCLRDHDTD